MCVTTTGLAADIAPTRFIAPNGMTVLVLEQHFLPIVEIHALIKAGAAQDPPEKAGVANLVASLLDEGTTTRSSRQLAEQIDFVGGSLSVQAGEDYTPCWLIFFSTRLSPSKNLNGSDLRSLGKFLATMTIPDMSP
jgi:zinc protease